MTKLEKLYAIIQNSKELGVNLGEDVLRQTNELEEKIIRDEILPIIGKNIEPTLRQIKRKLVLVVDYDPEAAQPLSVRMTRKRVITDEKDTKQYPLIPLSEPSSVKEPDHQKKHVIGKKHEGFPVLFPDGTVVEGKNAKETLIATLRKIGLDKASAFKSHLFKGFPLVGRNKRTDGVAKWQEEVDGWYIYINMPNETKVLVLQQLSDELHLNLNVQIKKDEFSSLDYNK